MWLKLAKQMKIETVNRYRLKLAILRAKKYDNRNFITCQTQDQYGIRKTGKDLGVVTQNCSNKVKPSALKKKKIEESPQTSTSSDDLEKEKQMISLREKIRTLRRKGWKFLN
ncbi:hypothetical protein GLOIN_2v1470661 [Rhizophagus irregularis DAOM 181602=DAOM 197198]|nr:hypothetical protein GLOIN_2v1470661 [Rhizophagus irregularis DAOM 181602=DAOM 197198]